MTLLSALKLALVASIFLSVLALALRARAADVFYLFREWRLGLRAFIAMFVVVPAVAIFIAYAFELKPAVEIALIALAFSPVPPLLPKKQIKAGGAASYTTGLMVGASLASLVAAPIGIALAGHVFGIETHVSVPGIVKTLGMLIAVPLALGLLAQRLFGESARTFASALGHFALLLLAACALVLLFVIAPALWAVMGDGTIVAIVAMILAGLAAGYLLAGPTPEDRAALSLAAAARHPGIAMGIAAVNFPDEKLAPAAILLFFILSAVPSMPLLHLLGKATAKPAA